MNTTYKYPSPFSPGIPPGNKPLKDAGKQDSDLACWKSEHIPELLGAGRNDVVASLLGWSVPRLNLALDTDNLEMGGLS